MKHIWILIFTVLSTAVISCGSNDDENESSNEPSNNPSEVENQDDKIEVKEELLPFVGLWDIKSDLSYGITYPDYNVFFYQDEKCHINMMSTTNNTEYNIGHFNWSFGSTEKTLSIAGQPKAQWKITAIGDDAWSGLSQWTTNGGYTAKKDTVTINILRFLFTDVELWRCDSVTATLDLEYDRLKITRVYTTDREKGNLYYNLSNIFTGDASFRTTSLISWNKQEDTFYIDYKHYWSGGNLEYGLYIEFVHPYSYLYSYMNISVEYHSANGQRSDSWNGKFKPERKKK